MDFRVFALSFALVLVTVTAYSDCDCDCPDRKAKVTSDTINDPASADCSGTQCNFADIDWYKQELRTANDKCPKIGGDLLLFSALLKSCRDDGNGGTTCFVKGDNYTTGHLTTVACQ